MLFLIDYENVGNAGMKGSNYLQANDHVIVFYSEARKNMERRFLESVDASGCMFEICKLVKTGKNALDFYIASRLGELFGGGYKGTAVIISNDNGFQAVQDYWGQKAPVKRRVLLSPCLEEAIANANENDERTKMLRRQHENISVLEYYSDYIGRLQIQEMIEKYRSIHRLMGQGTEWQFAL